LSLNAQDNCRPPGGFTKQDMHRSQVSARAVALVYIWWRWYVRAANPQARRQAQTSRPLLLAAVGRATSSGNQTTLHLTPMHAQAGLIKSMIANVHAAIQHVKAAAEQLPKLDRWRALLAYIRQRIVGQIGLPSPPPMFAAPGQLRLLGSITWEEFLERPHCAMPPRSVPVTCCSEASIWKAQQD
jgi:hypothetical protein